MVLHADGDERGAGYDAALCEQRIVDDHRPRRDPPEQRHQVLDVGGRGDRLHEGIRLQQRPECGSYPLVTNGDDHGNRGSVALGGLRGHVPSIDRFRLRTIRVGAGTGGRRSYGSVGTGTNTRCASSTRRLE